MYPLRYKGTVPTYKPALFNFKLLYTIFYSILVEVIYLFIMHISYRRLFLFYIVYHIQNKYYRL